MQRLREPETGCPWDQAQDYRSIAASTLEEAYEVVDAIEQEDYSQLKDELGDLLFQVIFYSQLGHEDGHFDFSAIVSSITSKLLRRHPHVFPDGTLTSRIDSTAINDERRQAFIKASWEKIKQEERAQKGQHALMNDIPHALPAIVRALKLQKRAATVGFDWENSVAVYEKIQEEIVELQAATIAAQQQSIEEELGDLLFSVINLARHLHVEPETALRRANHKFEYRFQQLEEIAKRENVTLSEQSVATLNQWWDEIKQFSPTA
jgi:ATP diphosphatase